jgi:hypothetical protein
MMIIATGILIICPRYHTLKVTFLRNDTILFQDFIPVNEPDHHREADLQRLINNAFSSASTKTKRSFCREITYHVIPRDIDWDPRYPFDQHKYFYLEAYDWISDPQRRLWCGPDVNFATVRGTRMETYNDVVLKIISSSKKPPKIDKVAWFGNIFSAGHPSDPPPYAPPEAKTRSQLLDYSSKVSDMFDFRYTCKQRELRGHNTTSSRSLWSWPFWSSSEDKGSSKKEDKKGLKQIPDPACTRHMPLHEMIENYAYLLDIGGWGYSGRLKYLLFSRRPLLFVQRRYVEYFHEDLIPYYHYIPVKEDLSDLVSQASWMMENREKAHNIAENAYQYAVANLTQAKAYERARQVFISQCPGKDGENNLDVH